MKESFYFPHDNNATQDPKIMFMISKCGLSALGLYWIIIELLHQQDDGMIRENEFNVFLDSYTQFEKNAQNLLAIVKTEFFGIGLLSKTEDGMIFSNRVLRNKQYREGERVKKSEAGKRGMEARWGGTITKKTTKNKPIKIYIKHGEKVKLTKEQYSKLCKDHSVDIINSMIDTVNDYCSAHGKSYKDYSAAIRQFLKKDGVVKQFNWDAYPDDGDLALILKDRPELHKEAKKKRPTALHLSEFL